MVCTFLTLYGATCYTTNLLQLYQHAFIVPTSIHFKAYLLQARELIFLASSLKIFSASVALYGTMSHNRAKILQIKHRSFINLLAPELFFLILAHPVYKM